MAEPLPDEVRVLTGVKDRLEEIVNEAEKVDSSELVDDTDDDGV